MKRKLLNISYIEALLESLAAVVIFVHKLFCHPWKNIITTIFYLLSKTLALWCCPAASLTPRPQPY